MSFCIYTGSRLKNELNHRSTHGLNYFIGDKTTPAPLVWIENSEILAVAIGDVFNCNLEDLLRDNWEVASNKLLGVLGEFSLVKVYKNTNMIHFASSKAGIENLYYYKNGDDFLITDNFWYALNIIKPKKTDVLKQEFIESVMYHYSLEYKTFIKNLHWLPPASTGIWNAQNKIFKISKYWEFKYFVDKDLDLDSAVERLDKILDNAMMHIKNKFGDVTYGVGLSGGLDSRIIPYYALKNGMRLKAFIIGEKHPKSFLLSRDHKSARKLAQHFGLELHEVSSVADEFDYQLINDIRTYPLGPSALGKLIENKIPNFDILLTGGNGLILGSELPKNIQEMTSKQLIDAIENHCNIVDTKSKVSRKLGLVNEFILNRTNLFNVENLNESEMIPGDVKRIANKKWAKFAAEKEDLNLSNLDIYEDYFNNHLGFRNRLGAFESLGGAKRSFSIYVPFVFEESLKWSISFLDERLLLKSLVLKKMPEIAGVRLQSYHLSINDKTNSMLKKIFTLIDFYIRGSGTGNLGSVKLKRPFLKLYKKLMNNEYKWFYDFIGKEDCEKLINSNNYKLMATLLKRKNILDIIECRKYIEYAEDFIKSETGEGNNYE